jgi:hypothetical protein
VQMSEPLFSEYEAAVDSFLRAGGHTPSVIRSPRALLEKYRSQFAGSTSYGAGVRIGEADQDFVSVRGTTIAGHEFEWPEPV